MDIDMDMDMKDDIDDHQHFIFPGTNLLAEGPARRHQVHQLGDVHQARGGCRLDHDYDHDMNGSIAGVILMVLDLMAKT